MMHLTRIDGSCYSVGIKLRRSQFYAVVNRLKMRCIPINACESPKNAAVVGFYLLILLQRGDSRIAPYRE